MNNPTAKVPDLMKELGRQWQALSQEEKLYYEACAQKGTSVLRFNLNFQTKSATNAKLKNSTGTAEAISCKTPRLKNQRSVFPRT